MPSTSDGLLTWFGEHCKSVLGVAIYEMFGLDDPFGRVMKSNLKVNVPSIASRNSTHAVHHHSRAMSTYPV